MAKFKLNYTRTHGYAYLVPAQRRELATFSGIDKDDPAAQRPFDIINGEQVPRRPKSESHQFWQNAWQDIAVYASEDGVYELSIKMKPGEEPAKQVEVDVP